MAGTWRGRTTAALAVAVAVLSGCSEEKPASDSLPSTSAATSTSAEALPPLGPPDFPVPDEARQKTPEGALEFIKYYLGLGSHIATGDLTPQALIDLSENCEVCHRVADSYQEDLAAGLSYRGFSFTFDEYAPPTLNGIVAEIGFVYAQSSYEVLDTRGQAISGRTVPATGPLQSGALMEWSPHLHSWVVTSLTIG